jgi:ribosomal protein L22
MKTVKFLALSLVVYAILAFAAEERTAPQKVYTREQVKDLIADLEAGNALSAVVVLEALRRGDNQRAIEALEFSVDSAVSSVSARMKGQEIVQDSATHQALLKVKAYRQMYPRSTATNTLGQAFDEIQKPIVEKADAFLKSVEKKPAVPHKR